MFWQKKRWNSLLKVRPRITQDFLSLFVLPVGLSIFVSSVISSHSYPHPSASTMMVQTPAFQVNISLMLPTTLLTPLDSIKLTTSRPAYFSLEGASAIVYVSFVVPLLLGWHDCHSYLHNPICTSLQAYLYPSLSQHHCLSRKSYSSMSKTLPYFDGLLKSVHLKLFLIFPQHVLSTHCIPHLT